MNSFDETDLNNLATTLYDKGWSYNDVKDYGNKLLNQTDQEYVDLRQKRDTNLNVPTYKMNLEEKEKNNPVLNTLLNKFEEIEISNNANISEEAVTPTENTLLTNTTPTENTTNQIYETSSIEDLENEYNNILTDSEYNPDVFESIDSLTRRKNEELIAAADKKRELFSKYGNQYESLSDGFTDLGDGRLEHNANKIYNELDADSFNDLFDYTTKNKSLTVNEEGKWVNQDGSVYEGPVARFYGINGKDESLGFFKAGITTFDSVEDRFKKFPEGELGVDVKDVAFDIVLPKNVAVVLEAVGNARKEALNNRILKDSFTETRTKEQLGSGATEYYQGQQGYFGNRTKDYNEDNGKNLFTAFSKITGLNTEDVIDQSIEDAIRNARKEYDARNLGVFGRLGNTVKGFGSAFVSELLVNPLDALGDITGLYDLGTSKEKQNYVDDFFGYNDLLVQEATEKVGEKWDIITDENASTGDKLNAVYLAVKEAFLTPELLGTSLGALMAWVVPGGFAVSKLSKAGKLGNYLEKAKQIDTLVKAEKLNRLQGRAEKTKRLFSTESGLRTLMASQVGQITAALGNVNNQYEEFVQNNNGVELEGGDKAQFFAGRLGVQIIAQNLDKIVDLQIMKQPALLASFGKSLGYMTNKEVSGVLNKLGKAVKETGKGLLITSANATSEAAQEYTQTMMELFNSRFGSEQFKDVSEFSKFILDERNTSEAAVGALMGIGGALQFETVGTVARNIKNIPKVNNLKRSPEASNTLNEQALILSQKDSPEALQERIAIAQSKVEEKVTKIVDILGAEEFTTEVKSVSNNDVAVDSEKVKKVLSTYDNISDYLNDLEFIETNATGENLKSYAKKSREYIINELMESKEPLKLGSSFTAEDVMNEYIISKGKKDVNKDSEREKILAFAKANNIPLYRFGETTGRPNKTKNEKTQKDAFSVYVDSLIEGNNSAHGFRTRIKKLISTGGRKIVDLIKTQNDFENFYKSQLERKNEFNTVKSQLEQKIENYESAKNAKEDSSKQKIFKELKKSDHSGKHYIGDIENNQFIQINYNKEKDQFTINANSENVALSIQDTINHLDKTRRLFGKQVTEETGKDFTYKTQTVSLPVSTKDKGSKTKKTATKVILDSDTALPASWQSKGTLNTNNNSLITDTFDEDDVVLFRTNRVTGNIPKAVQAKLQKAIKAGATIILDTSSGGFNSKQNKAKIVNHIKAILNKEYKDQYKTFSLDGVTSFSSTKKAESIINKIEAEKKEKEEKEKAKSYIISYFLAKEKVDKGIYTEIKQSVIDNYEKAIQILKFKNAEDNEDTRKAIKEKFYDKVKEEEIEFIVEKLNESKLDDPVKDGDLNQIIGKALLFDDSIDTAIDRYTTQKENSKNLIEIVKEWKQQIKNERSGTSETDSETWLKNNIKNAKKFIKHVFNNSIAKIEGKEEDVKIRPQTVVYGYVIRKGEALGETTLPKLTKTDPKGRKFSYFQNRTESNGTTITTFTFNRSDKPEESRSKAGVPLSALKEKGYEIDTDSIPENLKVNKVYEIRQGKGDAKADADVEFIGNDGEIFTGGIKLNRKAEKVNINAGTYTYSSDYEKAVNNAENGLVQTIYIDPSIVAKPDKATIFNSFSYEELLKISSINNYFKSIVEKAPKLVADTFKKPVFFHEKNKLQSFVDQADNPAINLLYTRDEDGKLVQDDNVSVALSVALNMFIKNSSSLLENKRKTKAQIAMMVGKDEMSLSKEAYDLLADKGLLYKHASNTVGKQVADLLGITRKNDTDTENQAYDALVNALGQMSLMLGVKQGMLEYDNTLPFKKYAKAVFGTDVTDNDAKQSFIKFKESFKKESITNITENMKEVEEELPVQNTQRKEPYFGRISKKIVKKAVDKLKREKLGLKTAEPTKAAAIRLMNTPFKANEALIEDILKNKEKVKKHLGFIEIDENNETYIKLSQNEKNSQSSKNREIEESIEALDWLSKELKDIDNEKDKEMYFEYFISKNGRFFVDSNTINFQGDKQLHRFLVLPSSFTNTFKVNKKPSKNPNYSKDYTFTVKGKDVTDFVLYSLAQAFGKPVEKMTPEEIREYSLKILNEFKTIDSVKTAKEFFIDDPQNLADLEIDIEMEHFSHVLQGFEFIEKMLSTKPNETFDSNLTAEFDALTSGFAIKLFQLPNLSKDGMQNWLSKVGVLTLPEHLKNTVSQLVSEGKIIDAYKTLAVDLNISERAAKLGSPDKDGFKAVIKIKNKLIEIDAPDQYKDADEHKNKGRYKRLLDSLLSVLPKLNEDGTVSSELRNLFKPPFMTFNYASSLRNIRKNLIVNEMLEDLASKIAKLDIDEKIKFKEVYDNPSNEKEFLIRFTVDFLAIDLTKKTDKQIFTEIDNLIKTFRTTEIGKMGKHSNVIENIKKFIDETYGHEVEKSLNKQFSPFVKAQEVINDTFKGVFKVFEARFESEILAARTGKNPISIQKEREIYEKLKNEFPAIKGPLSRMEADIEGGEIGIYSTTTAPPNSLQVTTKPSQVKITINSMKGASVKSSHTIKILSEAIAAGAVVPIHYIDGAMMAEMVNESSGDSVTIHDAFLLSIDKMEEGGKIANKKLFTINNNYSFIDELMNTAVKMSKVLIENKELYKKVKTKIKTEEGKYEEIDLFNYYKITYNRMKRLAEETNKNRQQLFDQFGKNETRIGNFVGLRNQEYEVLNDNITKIETKNYPEFDENNELADFTKNLENICKV